MSAPLAMNTKDGTCWTRRTVTSGGIALYAPESVTTCPRFVMATEAELAEHGIVGSAFALPMPVAPEPEPEDGPQSFHLVGVVTADDYDEAVYAAEQAESGMEGQGYKGSVWVQDDDGEAEELRARVAELEAERVALRNDALSMRGSLAPADGDRKVPFELGGTLAPAVDWLVDRVSELEARLAEYERPADEDPIAYTLTEKATARPGMQPAIRTDAPDFFQPGHTYSSTIFGGPFTVDYVGTNPGSGERYAHGWIHHEHDDSWAPNVVTGLFERFIDITRGGDA